MENTIRWIDFLPLAIFAWVPKMLGLIQPGGSWENAFYIGAAAALIQGCYMWYRAMQPDLIALAGYMFLMYGAFGYLTSPLLLLPYDWFDQSIFFVWVLLVALVATLVSPEGFIKGPPQEKLKNLQGSLLMIGLISLALLFSYIFDKYLGIGIALGNVLPSIGLIAARAAIREYLYAPQHDQHAS